LEASAPSDSAAGKRRHNEIDHDTGEPGKKITKMGFDNGGGHGSNRPKESSKSGYGGDPKVSVIPKSGHGAAASINGVAWDDSREKPPRPTESDGYSASPPKPVQSSNQRRHDDRSGAGRVDVFDDETIKHAAQQAAQLMKSRVNERQEKIETGTISLFFAIFLS